MRKRWWTVAAVALVGLGWSAGQVLSQDAGGEAGPGAEDPMMKAWMEYMTPGAEHERMAARAGEWTCEGKMWEGPGTEGTPLSGTATIRMIMGGRYQQQEYRGEMMGMPFDGLSITGYDNALKQFQSLWLDSMGTGISFFEGGRDEATKLVGTKGRMTTPMGLLAATSG